jgi:hypothetical protein
MEAAAALTSKEVEMTPTKVQLQPYPQWRFTWEQDADFAVYDFTHFFCFLKTHRNFTGRKGLTQISTSFL